MPEKSIREMTVLERKHYSLQARVFRATLAGSVVLGLIALLIGLGLYTTALINQYTSEAFLQSKNAASVLKRVVNVEPLADFVMSTYEGLSEEERAQPDDGEYCARFSAILENPDYQATISILEEFRETSDVSDIFLAMYTLDPARLVYIADPDENPSTTFTPGQWEEVEAKESHRFLYQEWDKAEMLSDVSMTKRYGWICTAGVPAFNNEGKVIAFVLADITLNEVARGMRLFLFQYILAMLIAVNAVGLLLSRRMRKTLVDPINDIAETAQDYVRDKRAGVKVTDHFSMLNIRTGDEIENLSLVMADMERDLSEYEENLTTAVKDRERINTELSLAKRIQAAMLPSAFPAFPERSDFDIYASMAPAKEVGGDFYDFYLIDEDHLAMAIADVSGKGIPAALFMAIAKSLMKNHAAAGMGPKELLEKLNRQICSNNPEEMFVTVWFGILDLRSGTLTAANAGHEYPLLRQPGGAFEVIKDKHGFVLGGMDEVSYQEYTLQLQPGARLFLYTDGVPEATSASQELFGMDRMAAVLNEVCDRNPQEILSRVHSAVDFFVGSAPQFDDLTMLCLEYRGPVAGKE